MIHRDDHGNTLAVGDDLYIWTEEGKFAGHVVELHDTHMVVTKTYPEGQGPIVIPIAQETVPQETTDPKLGLIYSVTRIRGNANSGMDWTWVMPGYPVITFGPDGKPVSLQMPLGKTVAEFERPENAGESLAEMIFQAASHHPEELRKFLEDLLDP